jgi:hypothetical protein
MGTASGMTQCGHHTPRDGTPHALVLLPTVAESDDE